MIRTLCSKGLNLTEHCRQRDPNRKGLMYKKQFYTMLLSIGLPFSVRDLENIMKHYEVPGTDKADYVQLLTDVNIAAGVGDYERELQAGGVIIDNDNNPSTVNNNNNKNGGDALSPTNNDNISVYAQVFTNVKKQLKETMKTLKLNPNEVYRMFARYDASGTGTVTAAQFQRVLTILHVKLSDDDEDFLVELLNISGNGQIDFEGLLGFCFAGDSGNGGSNGSNLTPEERQKLFTENKCFKCREVGHIARNCNIKK